MRFESIDFLRPTAPPRIGWVLLGIGLIALALALWCDRRWSIDRDEAERSLAAQTEARRLRSVPPPVLAPSAAERRLGQVQQERNHPWVAALHEVESATHAPVYLLSLQFDRSSQSVKLDAEAPSFDEALGYLQALDGSAVSSPVLVSHEQVTDANGGPRVRFAATAHWALQ